jgi:hypothetical protein
MKTFLIMALIFQAQAYAKDFDFLKIKNFFTNQASDFKCSEIDLRNETLGPNRYQGSVGWCFAYATADVASYKLGKKISAPSLAFSYYQTLQPDVKNIKISTLSGGNDQGALNFSKEELCLEEDMPSENFAVPNCNFNTRNIQDVLSFIENKLQSKTALSSCDQKIFNTLFPNLNADDINSIGSNDQISIYNKLLSMNNLNCQYKKIRAPRLSLKNGMSPAPNYIKDVDAQLENNNPVVINYNAGFLLNNADPKVFYNHYSSIFGRRLNKETNKCEYLIRNTWGTDCSIYPKEIQKNCDAGSIWIERELINNNLVNVTLM